MNPFIKISSTILLSAALAFITFYSIKYSKEIQFQKSEISELNDVKHGLLSVHNWKRQIDDILFKKIDEFYLDKKSREELKKKVEDLLLLGIDELERILVDDRINKGNLLDRLKGRATNWMADFPKLRQEVPNISSKLIDQLGDKATVSDIKRFIKDKLKEYLDDTFGKEDRSVLLAIQDKYGAEDAEECTFIINNQIKEKNKRILFFFIILSLITLIFIALCKQYFSEKLVYNAALLALTCLLIFGISIPMIDLDAKISDFSLTFLGGDIYFNNQVLFFQSKSILDVVYLLISTPDFQVKIVGFLIFTFSVLFPFGKIIAAFIAINKSDIFNNNKPLNFLLYKTGKWSMADVFVVAIFMAYIGFRGVINSQLSRLENSINNVQIITTNGTTLEIGFYAFTIFTLLSIYFSNQIAVLLKQKKEA